MERACLAATLNLASVLQPLSPRCHQGLPNCDNQKCVPETSTTPGGRARGKCALPGRHRSTGPIFTQTKGPPSQRVVLGQGTPPSTL